MFFTFKTVNKFCEILVKKVIVLSVFLLLSTIVLYPYTYRTQAFSGNIHTLQVLREGERYGTPVVDLQSGQAISISFDETGYISSNFHYKIIHCNSNWEQSSLSSMEYLDGFDGNSITNYDYSINTTVNYIHYQLSLPNEDVQFKVSGNYAVIIAKDNDFENGVVACACFTIVEPMARINATISGNTMKEINGKYQQLQIDIDIDQLKSVNPMHDFVLIVKQNGREDNQVTLTSPSSILSNKITYSNLQELIFEGGNQYRTIDFSSRYTYGSGIDRIRYEEGEYHVYLEPAQTRADKRETYNIDAHGDYAINYQDGEESDLEADYMWVHFYLPLEKPFLSGSMNIMGRFTGNIIGEESKMEYDFTRKYYYKSYFLKQGGYNYIYVFLPKGGSQATQIPIEGSFWQSSNQYEIYLYYKPLGSRYERLVGYNIVKN